MNLLFQSTLDYVGKNNVHPIGLLALGSAAIAICTVRRLHVPVVMLALAAFIPSAQRIVLAGADFNFVRALVLVGIVRIALRSEWTWIRWNGVDTCVALGALARVVCFPIVRGSVDDLIAGIGANFEIVGAYLLVRCCIRDLAGARNLTIFAAAIACTALPFFVLENVTGRNLFALCGGVPEITWVREGRVRCRGALDHAILAGCFFVAWLPLWIGLTISRVGKERRIGFAGIFAAVIIVACCASSTPVVALLLGAGVWVFFPLRSQLRLIYVLLIVLACILHFVMQAPIWHLISRIDLVGGSTGHHRYRLIDAAIDRFPEWWMIGTGSTAHWGWGLYDVTNQFVLEAVKGGLWALLAICGVFVFGYAVVGRELVRLAALRIETSRNRAWSSLARVSADEAFVFGLGAALCTQMAIFLAVSYFGQTTVVWQFLVALAACMVQWSADARRSRQSRVAVVPSRSRATRLTVQGTTGTR